VEIHFLQQKCLILREHCLNKEVYSVLDIPISVLVYLVASYIDLNLVDNGREEVLRFVAYYKNQISVFKTAHNKSQNLPSPTKVPTYPAR